MGPETPLPARDVSWWIWKQRWRSHRSSWRFPQCPLQELNAKLSFPPRRQTYHLDLKFQSQRDSGSETHTQCYICRNAHGWDQHLSRTRQSWRQPEHGGMTALAVTPTTAPQSLLAGPRLFSPGFEASKQLMFCFVLQKFVSHAVLWDGTLQTKSCDAEIGKTVAIDCGSSAINSTGSHLILGIVYEWNLTLQPQESAASFSLYALANFPIKSMAIEQWL